MTRSALKYVYYHRHGAISRINEGHLTTDEGKTALCGKRFAADNRADWTVRELYAEGTPLCAKCKEVRSSMRSRPKPQTAKIAPDTDVRNWWTQS